MRRVTRNGVIAVAAASGAMAITMPAQADSSAIGSAAGSPGVISGNTVQLPVHAPVNVCGNTVNVVGLLNPTAGNSCTNEGAGAGSGVAASSGGAATSSTGGVAASSGGAATSSGGAAVSSGGAAAQSGTTDSPGVLSGNGIQLPVDLPVNVSGNGVNVVGIGNAVTGNQSVNTSGGHPAIPTPQPSAPPRAYPTPTPPRAVAPPIGVSLAHTGADLTGPAVAGSAALLVTGVALYRRFNPRRER
ncbi:chaplin [Streptomyces sp. NPDC046805]|uniref:chaplin n=1 Tax=Streptomyces sp. NPDC046805 TaxID=3155134 RepID=UPI0033D0DF6C